jgi:hypothetical protein
LPAGVELQSFRLDSELTHKEAILGTAFALPSVLPGTSYRDTCIAEHYPAFIPPRVRE